MDVNSQQRIPDFCIHVATPEDNKRRKKEKEIILSNLDLSV